ncbi:hypothetical protein GCM10028792_20120 [Salinisphaera aquimarina]
MLVRIGRGAEIKLWSEPACEWRAQIVVVEVQRKSGKKTEGHAVVRRQEIDRLPVMHSRPRNGK